MDHCRSTGGDRLQVIDVDISKKFCNANIVGLNFRTEPLSCFSVWGYVMRDIMLVFSRILMSAIFIQAGLSKLWHFSGTMDYFGSLGLPLPSLVFCIVVMIELAGGFAILLGYRTRLAATILAFFSITAGAIGHSHISDVMHFQALMKDIAIAGGFFAIVSSGAGLISLDARRA